MARLFQWLGRFLSPDRLLDSVAEHSTVGDRKSNRHGGERPSIECDSVVRGFGEGDTRTLALKSVSLQMFPGHLNLLMGPSGSGKSTLLAVLSGLLRPDSGQVRALGRDVWAMDDREMEDFRLRHCSFIFQGYNLFPSLTARQQLEIILRWGEGTDAATAHDRADEVLGKLGMTKKAHLRPAQLSGGEKQRVAIGRALVKQPAFIFADEPTSALDWENGHQVVEMLRDAARDHGTTVLVVTHDERLLPYADRVFHLRDGRLVEGHDTDYREEEAVAHGPRQTLSDSAYAR